MNRFRSFLAFFLSAVFMVATTPHDLLHAGAGHEDTRHAQDSRPCYSEKHIHCEILKMEVSSYQDASVTCFSPHLPIHSLVKPKPLVISRQARKWSQPSRGPPA